MILIARLHQSLGEGELRYRGLIAQHVSCLSRLHGKRRLVRPRLRKSEIDELEHRLQIPARTISAKPFFKLSNKWARRRNLSGHQLPQINRAKLPKAAGGNYLSRGYRRNVVLITY